MAQYTIQITIIEVYEEQVEADHDQEAFDKISQGDWNNLVSFDSDYEIIERIETGV